MALPLSNEASTSNTLVYEALPIFSDVPITARHNLLLKKLNMCRVVFDFTDPTINPTEKDIKKQTLLELVDYIPSECSRFDETLMQEIMKMVAVNLFRTLPSPSHENKLIEMHDLDKEQVASEPAWSHVSVVYEILSRLVASSETQQLKGFIDRPFVLRLIDLFDSAEPRERDCLMVILHQIYSKFVTHRPFIRKAISNVFYQFVFETEKHNGIDELLEILESVIKGFGVPLKEEHKNFLVRTLMTLHKPKCLSMYHQQLSYCVTEYLEKDSKLAEIVIRGLLKYWPVRNISKELLFLLELEDILEAAQMDDFQLCMVPLFRRIALCLNSFHVQVAERTLYLCDNHHIRDLIIENYRTILPIIAPALERNASGHWNQNVRSLASNVRSMFAEVDQPFFDECLEQFRKGEIENRETRERRESAWKQLEEKALSNEAVISSSSVSSIAISTSQERTKLDNN